MTLTSIYEYAQLHPEAPEWAEAWHALARHLGATQGTEDAVLALLDGWQYMGTDGRGHCFRIRDYGTGNGCSLHVFITVPAPRRIAP